MLQDLNKFLLRGNVVDLAVAVIIGVAFGAVVASLVDDVIMAVIGAVFGKQNFNDLTFVSPTAARPASTTCGGCAPITTGSRPSVAGT